MIKMFYSGVIMEINKIASFTVDHDRLKPGMYISRVDGNITTYDLRTRTPNAGDYMSNAAMHSFEHLFATYIRSGQNGENVIYFGPMGCQTGFYLLLRNVDKSEVLKMVRDALQRIISHEGPVFGAERKECGNYRNHSLEAAKIEAERYLAVLDGCGNIDFSYA